MNSESGDDVFAPSIFLSTCNLRCPYCMNAPLISGNIESTFNIENIKDMVINSESELVNISGGEPTCTPIELLKNLINEIRSWNVKVGMSTNGTKSEVIREILPLLNFCYMDIKSSSRHDYLKIMPNDFFPEHLSQDPINSILISKSILRDEKNKRSDFDYEIRTTLYPPFIDKKAIFEIGNIMRKDEKWVLQQFRNNIDMLDMNSKHILPYDAKMVDVLVRIAKKYSNNVLLRYV